MRIYESTPAWPVQLEIQISTLSQFSRREVGLGFKTTNIPSGNWFTCRTTPLSFSHFPKKCTGINTSIPVFITLTKSTLWITPRLIPIKKLLVLMGWPLCVSVRYIRHLSFLWIEFYQSAQCSRFLLNSIINGLYCQAKREAFILS